MRPAARAVVAGVVLAVLAGCTAGGQGPMPDGAATEGAAPSGGAGDHAQDPVRVDRPAERVDRLDVAVPASVRDAVAVAPGWTARPVDVGGTLVGTREDDGTDLVLAVDGAGTVVWEAQRPAGTRLVPTRAGEEPVLVLAHAGADGATVAHGVDPATGTTLWGPLTVDGTLVGPGLVVEDAERRSALDPATGAPLAVDGTAVLEQDGTVVLSDGTTLRAVRAAEPGTPLWSVPQADLELDDGTPAAPADAAPPAGTALLATGEAGTLLDLVDGTAIATGVTDARADSALGTVVALAPGRLSGHAARAAEGGDEELGPGRDVLWSREVRDGTRLAASTGALAYLRVDDAVLVVNALTGVDAVAYEETGGLPLAVPALAATTGAVVVRSDRWLVLVPAA
ncbi:MAG: hypothetical protein H5T83_11725 [Actinotalea sp.]|nr:hypothetical protein [Actinotalea sp.]